MKTVPRGFLGTCRLVVVPLVDGREPCLSGVDMVPCGQPRRRAEEQHCGARRLGPQLAGATAGRPASERAADTEQGWPSGRVRARPQRGLQHRVPRLIPELVAVFVVVVGLQIVNRHRPLLHCEWRPRQGGVTWVHTQCEGWWPLPCMAPPSCRQGDACTAQGQHASGGSLLRGLVEGGAGSEGSPSSGFTAARAAPATASSAAAASSARCRSDPGGGAEQGRIQKLVKGAPQSAQPRVVGAAPRQLAAAGRAAGLGAVQAAAMRLAGLRLIQIAPVQGAGPLASPLTLEPRVMAAVVGRVLLPSSASPPGARPRLYLLRRLQSKPCKARRGWGGGKHRSGSWTSCPCFPRRKDERSGWRKRPGGLGVHRSAQQRLSMRHVGGGGARVQLRGPALLPSPRSWELKLFFLIHPASILAACVVRHGGSSWWQQQGSHAASSGYVGRRLGTRAKAHLC